MTAEMKTIIEESRLIVDDAYRRCGQGEIDLMELQKALEVEVARIWVLRVNDVKRLVARTSDDLPAPPIDPRD